MIAWLRVRRAPMVALMVVATALLVALFAEFLMPHDPEAINPAAAELPPAMLAGGDWAYLLGTDRLGRDIFSRVLLGTRVSLGIAAGAILIGAGIGTVLGMTAGYLGGITDAVIMRVADTFLAFPSVLMALVLAVAVGPSFGVVVLVLGLVLWARFARLVRSEVLSWKHRDFIALARIAGAGHPYIVVRHILPNLANTMVVLCTLQVGWAIVVEASLTFLGAGVPPPTPSWGGMIAEGLDSLESAWWLTVIPGLVVALVVFAFNLVGDWVRDLLDPGLANV